MTAGVPFIGVCLVVFALAAHGPAVAQRRDRENPDEALHAQGDRLIAALRVLRRDQSALNDEWVLLKRHPAWPGFSAKFSRAWVRLQVGKSARFEIERPYTRHQVTIVRAPDGVSWMVVPLAFPGQQVRDGATVTPEQVERARRRAWTLWERGERWPTYQDLLDALDARERPEVLATMRRLAQTDPGDWYWDLPPVMFDPALSAPGAAPFREEMYRPHLEAARAAWEARPIWLTREEAELYQVFVRLAESQRELDAHREALFQAADQWKAAQADRRAAQAEERARILLEAQRSRHALERSRDALEIWRTWKTLFPSPLRCETRYDLLGWGATTECR